MLESLRAQNNSLIQTVEISKTNLQSLEEKVLESTESYGELDIKYNKLSSRCDLLIKDNAALEGALYELKKRMAYYNETIATMKGSIRSFVRVRPLFEEELEMYRTSESDLSTYIQFPEFNIINYNGHLFELDRVFSPGSDERELFEEVEPYVWTAMSGYRVGIFS